MTIVVVMMIRYCWLHCWWSWWFGDVTYHCIVTCWWWCTVTFLLIGIPLLFSGRCFWCIWWFTDTSYCWWSVIRCSSGDGIPFSIPVVDGNLLHWFDYCLWFLMVCDGIFFLRYLRCWCCSRCLLIQLIRWCVQPAAAHVPYRCQLPIPAWPIFQPFMTVFYSPNMGALFDNFTLGGAFTIYRHIYVRWPRCLWCVWAVVVTVLYSSGIWFPPVGVHARCYLNGERFVAVAVGSIQRFRYIPRSLLLLSLFGIVVHLTTSQYLTPAEFFVPFCSVVACFPVITGDVAVFRRRRWCCYIWWYYICFLYDIYIVVVVDDVPIRSKHWWWFGDDGGDCLLIPVKLLMVLMLNYSGDIVVVILHGVVRSVSMNANFPFSVTHHSMLVVFRPVVLTVAIQFDCSVVLIRWFYIPVPGDGHSPIADPCLNCLLRSRALRWCAIPNGCWTVLFGELPIRLFAMFCSDGDIVVRFDFPITPVSRSATFTMTLSRWLHLLLFVVPAVHSPCSPVTSCCCWPWEYSVIAVPVRCSFVTLLFIVHWCHLPCDVVTGWPDLFIPDTTTFVVTGVFFDVVLPVVGDSCGRWLSIAPLPCYPSPVIWNGRYLPVGGSTCRPLFSVVPRFPLMSPVTVLFDGGGGQFHIQFAWLVNVVVATIYILFHIRWLLFIVRYVVMYSSGWFIPRSVLRCWHSVAVFDDLHSTVMLLWYLDTGAISVTCCSGDVMVIFICCCYSAVDPFPGVLSAVWRWWWFDGDDTFCYSLDVTTFDLPGWWWWWYSVIDSMVTLRLLLLVYLVMMLLLLRCWSTVDVVVQLLSIVGIRFIHSLFVIRYSMLLLMTVTFHCWYVEVVFIVIVDCYSLLLFVVIPLMMLLMVLLLLIRHLLCWWYSLLLFVRYRPVVLLLLLLMLMTLLWYCPIWSFVDDEIYSVVGFLYIPFHCCCYSLLLYVVLLLLMILTLFIPTLLTFINWSCWSLLFDVLRLLLLTWYLIIILGIQYSFDDISFYIWFLLSFLLLLLLIIQVFDVDCCCLSFLCLP